MGGHAFDDSGPVRAQSVLLHYYRPTVVTPAEYLQQQQRQVREARARELRRTLYWYGAGAVLALLLSFAVMLMIRSGTARAPWQPRMASSSSD